MMKTKIPRESVISFWMKILFILSVFLPCTQVNAEENQTIVKVGFFELPGFHEVDQDGNLYGYDIEYLNKIAEYTRWKYEFVRADSWPQALKMLENKQIDLLAPSQKTVERQRNFEFSTYAIGSEYGSLLTLDTNNQLIYEDFTKFSQIKIGCVETLVFKDAFFDYANRQGFTPQMVYYKDTNALLSALNVGEVDAIVANLMVAKKNMKVLAKFSPSLFYYMVQKDNPRLLEQLNRAIFDIKIKTPNFENELADKYYGNYNHTPFTKDELDYIAQADPFIVACLGNTAPVSYADPNTGEIKGITREILERISTISGLKFQYAALPEGKITGEFLRDHDIDLLTSVEYNGINKQLTGLELSDPYIATQKVIVGRRGEDFSKDKPLRLALATGSQTLAQVVKQAYPNFEVMIYDTTVGCLDAVLSGDADVMMQNQYVVEMYLPKPYYEGLAIVPNEGISDKLCLAALVFKDMGKTTNGSLADPRLMSIINKSIAQLSNDEISRIIIGHAAAKQYRFTLGDFFYRYRYLLVALMLVSLISLLFYLRARDLRITNHALVKDNEQKLRNITNNINGGVVVLLPDKGFRITYANTGFLELIQFNREEYEGIPYNDYITYVHPEDMPLLNELIARSTEEERQLSLNLRICRKDGTYVPTLFNGTLAKNKTGDLALYCVIMDISEQQQMLETLELEQERYRLLVEKSNDLIFDFDLQQSEITLAHQFETKFGWSMPKHFLWHEAAKVWWIYAEDKKIFDAMFHQLFIGEEDSECVVRIMKSTGDYLWCRVSIHMMKKEDRNIRIIGKITDIDAEVREREKLVYQAENDLLTGLLNKTTFQQQAKQMLQQKSNVPTALVFMDLDNFKQINDVLGHLIGDQVIKDTGKKLRAIFDAADLIARFGGDEFCLFVEGLSRSQLESKLDLIVEQMQVTYEDGGKAVSISSSIGVVYEAGNHRGLDDLLLCADKALYSAKEKGKNQYEFYYDDLELDGYTVKNNSNKIGANP